MRGQRSQIGPHLAFTRLQHLQPVNHGVFAEYVSWRRSARFNHMSVVQKTPKATPALEIACTRSTLKTRV